MPTYEEFIVTTLDYYKEATPPLRLATELNGRAFFYLRPITFDYHKFYIDLPSLLGKWRKANPTLSTSVFEITKENTTNWLENLVLRRKDRILFMIDSVDYRHIGHIGYSSFNFKEHSAEIDCVLRGEISPVPNLMHNALMGMLNWGKEVLLLNHIYLSVNKDNPKAIKLYKDCGFQEMYDIPLFRKELPNGEIRWDADENRSSDDAEKFGIMMKYVGGIHA